LLGANPTRGKRASIRSGGKKNLRSAGEGLEQGAAMRPTTRRLVSVAVLIFVVWVVCTLVSILAGWPAQFGGPGNPNNVAGEFLNRGTALAPPLFVMVAFVVFVVLVPNQRWWGVLGVVGLCLLAVLTVVGSLGEALAPSTPDVPRAVLVASGILGVVLGPLLLFFGIAELRDRARRELSRVR
jgi:hypothetical protein